MCWKCKTRPQGPGGGEKQGAGGGNGDRSSQWACSHCDYTRNFAWRDKCHQCGRPRAGDQQRGETRSAQPSGSALAQCVASELAKAKAAKEAQSPVEKQDAMEEEAQNALGPSPATPDRQKQLADLDATISRLNSDPDPEIQAIVSKRRAQREELVLQLRAAKPLPVQLKIASEARDKANKKRDAIKQEVDNLEQLLALKNADLLEATAVATEAQSEYLRLAAAAASEGQSLQNMAAQQQAAAIQLVGLLPPQAAASFQNWWQQVLQDGSGTEEELSQGDAELQQRMAAAAGCLPPTPIALSSGDEDAQRGASGTAAPNAFAPFRVAQRHRVVPYAAGSEQCQS